MPTEERFLKAAVWYAEHGWKVFPLLERGKTPRTKHGVKDASSDLGKIRAWWKAWPSANIGLACGPSKIIVVDVDARNGGIESWNEILAEHSGIDETVRSRTGGGGFHLFYRVPESQTQESPAYESPTRESKAQEPSRFRNTAGKIGRGIDTRADGGYVVLPPSIHPGGSVYVWDEAKSPVKLKCSPIPQALVDRLESGRARPSSPSPGGQTRKALSSDSPYVRAALAGELEKLRKAPEGTRNQTLNEASFALGQLIAAGLLDRGTVETILAGASLEIGLGATECRSTIRSGIEAGMLHPRVIEEATATDARIPPRPNSPATSSEPPTEPPEEDAQPIPLGVAQPSPMSAGIFTGWLGEMIEAEAVASETPRELAAMIALGVLAAACQKTFSIRPEPGYFEPLNLWVAPALDPGNRKTTVMTAMTAPLIDWERERIKAALLAIRLAESEAKLIQLQIATIRKRAARSSGEKLELAKKEIAALETEMPPIPSIPRTIVQDVTPEHLGTMLSTHDERLAIFSDEGGLFDLMAGRYSNGIPNLDIYLQAHSGASVRVDRGSRDPVILHHPTLTITLSPQPSVLRGLIETKSFRSRGLLARFLFLLPVSMLGYRRLETTPVPEAVKTAYDAAIRSLLEMTPIECGNGEKRPNYITLSPEAWNLWKDYSRVVEIEMRPGERFEHMTDWAGKFPGAVARIAALLHCAEHAHARPDASEVSAGTMGRTLKLADLLAEHALAVFDMMGADTEVVAASRIWKWIEKNRKRTVTAREIGRALRSVFHTMDELDLPLKHLVDLGYITERPPSNTRGRPSRIFDVNQGVAGTW